MSDENKKIEVVPGNGSDLNISPVYDHLNAIKPKTEKPKIKKKKNECIFVHSFYFLTFLFILLRYYNFF